MELTLYRPRSEASEGYVFTGVCHSFCSTGGGGGGGRGGVQHQRSTTPPPDNTSLPPRVQFTTPPYLPPGPGHKTSPLGPGHNTSPPPPGPGHNTFLPPPLGPGHNTSPPPPPGTMRRHKQECIPVGCVLSAH